jgi:transcriptional regulator with XRE-family HTH domain
LAFKVQALLSVNAASRACKLWLVAKERKFKAQGDQLKAARGKRKLRELAAAVGVSIGRLQNWENGFNRPDVALWPGISGAYGLDLHALYQGVEAPHSVARAKARMIPADAVLPLLDDLEKKLTVLRAMCGKPVKNKVVEGNGYTKRKHPVTA